MLLIPAIDLKDGRCVRLRQGDLDDATVFSEDPAAMAARWLDQGARRLHLVDLNGAVAGKPKNEAPIKAILDAVGDDIPVQIGGGIRDLDTIERYLDAGISYVIIGTAAVKNPGFLQDACGAFPGQIIVGLDARDGMLSGVNVEATVRLAQHVRIPVYASGGIAGIQDIEALCAVEEEGVEGAILGRSIYEGTLDFRSAQARADELAK
jgi:phosphoribosylformimino-5-aminoimidazole carboxamide ribotide isomerase